VLRTFIESLDDLLEALNRQRARVPFQCVDAEASDAKNKVVGRRPQRGAGQKARDDVVNHLVAILRIGIEKAIHQFGSPSDPDKSLPKRAAHPLNCHALNRRVKTVPSEVVSLGTAACLGQPGVKERQAGLTPG
jgi:hypothetical protein